MMGFTLARASQAPPVPSPALRDAVLRRRPWNDLAHFSYALLFAVVVDLFSFNKHTHL